MEDFALYLLRSVIWLSGFALVYIFFLRNERYFNLNRFYLISGIMVSFILPFVSIHYTVTIPVLDSANTGNVIVSGTEEIGSGIIPGLKMLLLILYLSGSIFCLFLVLKQGRSILRILKQSEIFLYNSLKLIRSCAYANSFSYSLNKKRFIMMKNIMSSPYRKLKLLLILPVIAVVLYSFALPEYTYIAIEDSSIVMKTQGKDQEVVTKLITPQETEKKVKKEKSDEEALLPPPPPPQSLLTIPPPPPLMQDTVKYRPSDGKQPLVVIDGKVTDIDLDLINPDAIESIDVIKGIRATNRYGEKGANGVIEITTKKKVSGITGAETEPKATNINEIEVIGYGNNTEKSSGIKIRSSSDGSSINPLIILDGEVYEKSIEEIDKDDIESISVLKDKSFIELYGEKGKDGVIIITTKKKSEK